MRPAERVLVVFLAYALVRLLVAGDAHLEVRALPPFDLALVFASVAAVRLFADHRRTPWPASTRAARREHFAFLAVALVVSVAFVVAVPRFRPSPGQGGGVATEVVLAVHAWIFAGLLFTAPLAVFWLASAAHIKEHGRMDARAMLRARGPAARDALREWAPLLLLLYAYGLMERVIGRGLFADMDGTLERVDRALFFGHDPRMLLEPAVSPWLSSWLSASYVLYVPMVPLVVGALFARRDLAGFREVVFALTLTLAVGYVLYTVVPVRGPLFVTHYDVPLDGYYGEWIKKDLLDPSRVPRDCFPSLHTAVSLVLLWGAYRHVRRLFWILVPIVASIPLACVYFRYHYVVDVIGGGLLFAFVRGYTMRVRALL